MFSITKNKILSSYEVVKATDKDYFFRKDLGKKEVERESGKPLIVSTQVQIVLDRQLFDELYEDDAIFFKRVKHTYKKEYVGNTRLYIENRYILVRDVMLENYPRLSHLL